jgi:hypothetical protein
VNPDRDGIFDDEALLIARADEAAVIAEHRLGHVTGYRVVRARSLDSRDGWRESVVMEVRDLNGWRAALPEEMVLFINQKQRR